MEERTKLISFQSELQRYLESVSIDASITLKKETWANFLTYYLAVIEDCPLKSSEPGLKYTDTVVVRVIHSNQAPITSATGINLVIRWEYLSKMTGKYMIFGAR